MANEGSTKPTYSELEEMVDGLQVAHDKAHSFGMYQANRAEELETSLARVRGLLQRQWISVEERLPKVGEMVLLYVGGSDFIETGWRCFDGQTHIFQLERTEPQDEPITYEVADGRVTHWMPLPVPPNFPQSSSLVPSGAESADIGKLDTADKSGVEMGKVNRVEEKGCEHLRLAYNRKLSRDGRVPPHIYYNCEQCPAILEHMPNGDMLEAGSAETGGEKAGCDSIELAKKICWEIYGDASLSAITIIADTIDYIERRPNFPRSSQNQTVSSGVEGAHEGTTADKDSHEIAKKIVDANAWERASGGWYIDESAFENLQIDIAEAIHDAESREPEKLNNAQKRAEFIRGAREGWMRACVFYLDIDAEYPDSKYSKDMNERWPLVESSLSSPKPTRTIYPRPVPLRLYRLSLIQTQRKSSYGNSERQMIEGMKVGKESVLVRRGDHLFPKHEKCLADDYGKPDIERAKREKTLCGDPMIASAWCNYPEGEIIDYYCLACGSTFAAHDEDSSCWRVLKSEEELARYDEAMASADSIRYGD